MRAHGACERDCVCVWVGGCVFGCFSKSRYSTLHKTVLLKQGTRLCIPATVCSDTVILECMCVFVKYVCKSMYVCKYAYVYAKYTPVH